MQLLGPLGSLALHFFGPGSRHAGKGKSCASACLPCSQAPAPQWPHSEYSVDTSPSSSCPWSSEVSRVTLLTGEETEAQRRNWLESSRASCMSMSGLEFHVLSHFFVQPVPPRNPLSSFWSVDGRSLCAVPWTQGLGWAGSERRAVGRPTSPETGGVEDVQTRGECLEDRSIRGRRLVWGKQGHTSESSYPLGPRPQQEPD